MKPLIYLDYNSGAPLDPRVIEVMVDALHSECGNPSSIHSHGQIAKKKIEKSRKAIADCLKAKPDEIIFTSGGTEGAHLLIHGIFKKRKSHIITSNIEHACVYRTVKLLEAEGCQVSYLAPDEKGSISVNALESAIQGNTELIVLSAANNETGVKIDWIAIAELAEKRKIPFVLDCVALMGKEAVEIPKGVSAAFFSGHKIYGPKGIGCCFLRKSLKILPTFLGGHQEFNLRAGTQNLSGIIGMGKAFEILQEEPGLFLHLKEMRDLLEHSLLSNIENVEVNGKEPRIVNTTNLSFIGIDSELLLMRLDLAGICVSSGPACSSGGLEPSRVLTNMKLSQERIRSALRFSVGKMTTKEEIHRACELITKITTDLKSFF